MYTTMPHIHSSLQKQHRKNYESYFPTTFIYGKRVVLVHLLLFWKNDGSLIECALLRKLKLKICKIARKERATPTNNFVWIRMYTKNIH